MKGGEGGKRKSEKERRGGRGSRRVEGERGRKDGNREMGEGRTKARGNELVKISPHTYLVGVSPLEDTVWWRGGGDNGSIPHRLQPLHKLIQSYTTLLVLVKVFQKRQQLLEGEGVKLSLRIVNFQQK